MVKTAVLGLGEGGGGYTQASVQISTIIPIVCILLSTGILLRHIRLLRAREWVSLLMYELIPVTGAFVQFFVPGVWLTFLGVLVSLFFIYMNIQAELSRRALEQEIELGQNRVSVMLSQIQPHFLYNALSAIEDLCDKDADKTKTAIDDFARYLRGSFGAVTKNI